MPQLDSNNYYIAISNQPYQPSFINQPSNVTSYALSPMNMPPSMPQYCQAPNSGASILTSSSYAQSSSGVVSSSIDSNTSRSTNSQNRPFGNRTSNNDSFGNGQNSAIRRTKSGYISKSRVAKRSNVEINLHKSCPGCLKLWRKCQCSNIKNRPDPKPYCKFIPPRMLRKLNANN